MRKNTKSIIALSLCMSCMASSISPATTYAKGTNMTVKSIEGTGVTYNEKTGYFEVTGEIDQLTGTLNGMTKDVTSVSYQVTDSKGIVVKEGSVDPEKQFTMDELGFALGENTLKITTETKSGSKDTYFPIYNTSIENTLNMDVDMADSDNDGLVNYWEEFFGTDKNKADTDNDGLSDLVEITVLGTDPLKSDTDGNGVKDGDEDFDEDGLTNLQEVKAGTDPCAVDSDGDSLSDYDEINVYGTDPMNEDTDNDGANDGWEVADGFNPKKRDKKFELTVSAADNSATLYSKKLIGSEAQHFTLNVVENDVYNLASTVGALSQVYELGENVKATLSIKHTKKNDAENPQIYCYDIAKQKLIYLKSTYKDGYLSANTKDDKESRYIVLDKTAYDKYRKSANKKPSTSGKDSNKDGISDADAQSMCNGTLTMATGEKVFGDATYEEVQKNADFDGDGLTNGEEITIATDDEGTRYVILKSSPILLDTDGDGINDKEDTAPLERGLKDGIVGTVQLYSRHETDQSFMLGHAFLVYTSYINGQSLDIKGINRSYRYDEMQETYVERSGDHDIYDMNRGDYVSIGNYRSVALDIIYDIVMGDFDQAFKDSGFTKQRSYSEDLWKRFEHYLVIKGSSILLEKGYHEASKNSIRYNEEIYATYAYEGFIQYPNAVITKEVTQEQLDAITAFAEKNNYYGLLTNNCSSIASGAWNAAFDDTLYARESKGLYSIFDTPMILKAHILERDGVQVDVETFGVSL
ncbi:MAG: hypothetical protein Q4G58_07645 [bacterium]|nr:hypothetical protein [bacterium]